MSKLEKKSKKLEELTSGIAALEKRTLELEKKVYLLPHYNFAVPEPISDYVYYRVSKKFQHNDLHADQSFVVYVTIPQTSTILFSITNHGPLLRVYFDCVHEIDKEDWIYPGCSRVRRINDVYAISITTCEAGDFNAEYEIMEFLPNRFPSPSKEEEDKMLEFEKRLALEQGGSE
jgi:hypothetical protein